MKKFSRFLLMAVVALGAGFTACNNDDVPQNGTDDGAKANTHVAVTFSVGSNTATPRALPQDYNPVGTWAGKDKIEKINIYLVDNKSVTSWQSAADLSDDYTQTGNVLTPKATGNAAIATSAGLKKVFVVINGTNELISDLSTAANTSAGKFEEVFKTKAYELENKLTGSVPNQTLDYSSAQNFVTQDGTNNVETIVMTNNNDVTINVQENVKKEETLASANPKNRVSVNVERTVARVMVTRAEGDGASTDEFKVKLGSEVLGTVKDITWVVAQGENSLYLQRKNDCQTPKFSFKPTGWTPADWTEAAAGYDYSGLFENRTNKLGGTDVPTLAQYSDAVDNGEIKENFLNDGLLDGRFILPTIHPEGTSAAACGYLRTNTAYVMVRARFVPETFADAAHAASAYTEGDDFYMGENGLFYIELDNVVDPDKGGVAGQSAYTYVEGKTLYYAWVNPSTTSPATWWNSPVIRNNVYHIHITGFKGIGSNWNPYYPEDPDEQDPTNPDPKPTGTPTPPTPGPLPDLETWMSVEANILPWNVHSYEIEM